MTILYRPGKLHCNADALSRIDTRLCPHEHCPAQDCDHDLDTDLVPSLSGEEIKVSQKLDPELCRFIELLHKNAVKPNSKSLREEPPDVKIMCYL